MLGCMSHKLESRLLFSRSVISDSLRPHGLQHTMPSCPSPSPAVCSKSCPLSWWYHPITLSSVIPFSCLHSFPTSWSFPISLLFASRGQSIGASASISALPMNIQGWFPLGLTDLVSLLSKGIKIAGRDVNSLRYADDTTLMIESEEELKSVLKVKEESKQAGLKLSLPKTKIMASSLITSWEKKVEAETYFFSWSPESLQMVTVAMKLQQDPLWSTSQNSGNKSKNKQMGSN